MTCDMGFMHEPVEEPPTDAEVEAAAVKAATVTEAEAEVRIAEIEAATALELAKLERSALLDEERIELEALRAEVEMFRQQAAPPEPDPTPVEVVEAPEEEAPAVEEPPAVEEASAVPEPSKKRKSAWWG